MTHRALMVLFCLSLPVFGQTGAGVQGAAAQAEAQSGRVRDNAHLSLDVVVTDKSGKLVTGLQQQDFTVLDNKKLRSISSFRAVPGEDAAGASGLSDPPTRVILLIDSVNTTYQRVAFERDQIKKFLQQNGGKLAQPVSLVFFSDQGSEIQEVPSSDGSVLLADLDEHTSKLRTIRRSTGFYGAEERYQLSLTALNAIITREVNKPGRKLLVWVSPGWPLLSGPGINLSQADSRMIFNNIVALSQGLRDARITLYAVDPLGMDDAGSLRQTYYEDFLKGVPSAKQAQSGNLALEVLSIQSGGMVFKSGNDVWAEIGRGVADAASYYALSVDVLPAEHANEYHGIEVKVDKPGLTARTRTGYYAQP
jgi:VWFA-related protein